MSKKLFNSRFFLTFSNSTYEDQYTDFSYIGIECKNFISTIILSIFAAINIVQLYQRSLYILEYFLYISYILLGINLLSIVLLIIFLKRKKFNEMLSIGNLIISGFYFHIFVGVNMNMRAIQENFEYTISAVSVCVTFLNLVKVGFALFILKGFRNNFITLSVSFAADVIFICLTFHTFKSGLMGYLLTNFIIYLVLILYDFVYELKARSFYYSYKELEGMLSESKSFVGNSKNPYFSYNTRDNDLQYLNRSIHNLYSFFEKHMEMGIGSLESISVLVKSSTKALISKGGGQPRFSYYGVLKDNYISYHEDDQADKVISSRRIQFTENLFNQMVYINEELPIELYDYMNKLKSEKLVFSLPTFSKIVMNCYSTNLPTGMANSVSFSTNNMPNNDAFINTYTHINNTQTAMLFKKTASTKRTFSRHKTLITAKNKLSEYILLGKVRVKFDKNKDNIFYKEYFIYFDILGDCIYFIIEDYNTILAKERKDTVQTCRNLYLSKISHEFKNPLCNILELLSLLNDDVRQDNPPGEGVLQNLSILQNICEMMSLLIKDFSFYSNLMIDEEEGGMGGGGLRNIESLVQSPKFKNSQFTYRDPVSEIFDLFTNKAKIDKRDQRVVVKYELDEWIPDSIECDREIFLSLLFNIIFHCYKVIIFGNIKLNVSKADDEHLKFEIELRGSTTSKKGDTLFKNYEKVVNESFESNRSFGSEDGNKNAESTYIVENYHIQNLFALDANQRNSVIDEFNNNFNILISHLYAKRLGSKLNIQTTKDKLLISFSVKGANSTISFSNIPKATRKSQYHTTKFSRETFGKKTDIKLDFTENPNTSVGNTQYLNDEIFSIDTIRKDYNIIYDHLQMEKLLSSSGFFSITQPYLVKRVKTPEMKPRSIINTSFMMSQQNYRRLSNTLYHTQKESIYKNTESRIAQSLIKYDSFSKKSKKSSACLFNIEKLEHVRPNLRVLLVDDEMLIRKCLTRYFNKYGNEKNMVIDICEAENGFECIEQLYKYSQENKNFDLIIIDETMPIVRGTIVIEMIKNIIFDDKLDNITIISYTSYDSEEKKEYILSKGADFIITKPIKYDEFVNVIEKVMKNK
jgi:CheY-like chemotaxis protein